MAITERSAVQEMAIVHLIFQPKKKTVLPSRIFSEPPSRNDAFIWQIRNYLAQDQFTEAASLIQTLKNDPLFPKRLYNDLEEVQAYSFYKQKMWDSSAAHLENALEQCYQLKEKARWEYLLGQLYEMTGKYKEAEKYYTKVHQLILPIPSWIYMPGFGSKG